MNNSTSLPTLLAIVLISGLASTSQAVPKPHAREYRPLAAKAVKMQVAGAVGQQGKGAAMTREGWAHFDKQEWEKAMDRFLSALEADTADESAAEGLTMAVYRSGDLASAAELAEELANRFPWVRGAVAELILEEVKDRVEKGEITAAEAIVERLPYGDGIYDETRSLVEAAGNQPNEKVIAPDTAGVTIATPVATSVALVDGN